MWGSVNKRIMLQAGMGIKKDPFSKKIFVKTKKKKKKKTRSKK
jgi:hypothetical protein